MQLRITHRGNELLTFPANLLTQVTDVKAFIANSLGLSTNDIILTFNGTYLEDAKCLADYSVMEYGSLQLHLPIDSLKIVSVRVIVSPEEVFSIPLRTNSAVADLKMEIGKRMSARTFDPQNAFLVYSHYILEDSRTLEEYGITDNAGIIVAHTLDGEKFPSSETYDYCEDFKEDSTAESHPKPIAVHFLIEDGDPLTIMLDPTKPLSSVSKRIELETGIPPSHQTFFLSGDKVNAEKTLEELNIKEEESLFLKNGRVREIYPSTSRRRYSDMAVVFSLEGQKIRMRLSGDTTVSDVIGILQTKHKINKQKIFLLFNDTRLDPRKRLYEYGITDGSLVTIETLF